MGRASRTAGREHKTIGLVNPVILRKKGESWQIVCGFKRVEAAKKLGQRLIKARLFDELPDWQAAAFAILDNFSATDISAVDALEFEAKLKKAGISHPVLSNLLLGWRKNLERKKESVESDVLASLIKAEKALEKAVKNWTKLEEKEKRMLERECRYFVELYSLIKSL